MGEVHVRVTLCFHCILFNYLPTYSLIYLFFLDLYVCLCYHHHPCVTFVLYHILPGAAFRATSAWPPRWGTKASVRCGEKGSDFFSNDEDRPSFGLFMFSLPLFSLPLSFLLVSFLVLVVSFPVAVIGPSEGPLDFKNSIVRICR